MVVCVSDEGRLAWNVEQAEALTLRLKRLGEGLTLQVEENLWTRWTRLPHSQNPKVLASWQLSRLALEVLLGELVDDEREGTWLISISHTEGFALAGGAIATDEHPLLGFGVDCERADRTVLEELDKRIRHSEDPSPLSALDLWTVKEACHKAGGFGARTAFSDYRIELRKPGSAVRVHSPSSNFEAAVSTVADFRVAAALRVVA